MATVRLYVALAVLLMATCFHTTEGGWLRRRRRRGSSCNRVNCQWSSWSSWSTCTYCRSGLHNYVVTSYSYNLIAISSKRTSMPGPDCDGLLLVLRARTLHCEYLLKFTRSWCFCRFIVFVDVVIFSCVIISMILNNLLISSVSLVVFLSFDHGYLSLVFWSVCHMPWCCYSCRCFYE